jgi:transposase
MFIDFFGLAANAHPDMELHVVCDNYATHKHPNVNAWLVENPRVTMHFTPTSCSWLNMVEIFFGIDTKQAIRRGSFHSVDDLEATIGPKPPNISSARCHKRIINARH